MQEDEGLFLSVKSAQKEQLLIEGCGSTVKLVTNLTVLVSNCVS